MVSKVAGPSICRVVTRHNRKRENGEPENNIDKPHTPNNILIRSLKKFHSSHGLFHFATFAFVKYFTSQSRQAGGGGGGGGGFKLVQ